MAHPFPSLFSLLVGTAVDFNAVPLPLLLPLLFRFISLLCNGLQCLPPLPLLPLLVYQSALQWTLMPPASPSPSPFGLPVGSAMDSKASPLPLSLPFSVYQSAPQ